MCYANGIWEKSLQLQAEQGYVIAAYNLDNTDYVACAQRLARSIRCWDPAAKICLLTNTHVTDKVFDYVKLVPVDPSRTAWSYDAQCWKLSPFRETVKLEADMLIVSDITHWWTMFRHRDVVISHGCRDYYDRVASSRYYRELFDRNSLPDVYNAVTYWRRSTTAMEFFAWVNRIFGDWPRFRNLISHSPNEPDTDLVYAMAAQIMGPDLVTLPFASYPRIVHMKQHIIGTHSAQWHRELVWEYHDGHLRINTIAQWGAVHYHHKTWQP